MADFCKACSIDVFGEDFGNLAGITKQEYWEANTANLALCEDCGYIQIDPDGNCVSTDCLNKGKPGHGLPWPNETIRTSDLEES